MSFDPKSFNEPASASVGEKRPTYLQWIKSAKKADLKKAYLVTLIWAPGEWDNFTLECEEFRLRLTPKNPMYAAMDAFTSDPSTANTELRIQPVEGSPKQFMIIPKESNGLWSEFHDHGYKWQT